MAFPKEKDERTAAPKTKTDLDPSGQSLRERAVAIDPPPEGAIGIEELLGRFERFAEAQALTAPPEKGPVGVRELLARLGNLADAGYFSTTRDEEQEDK